MRLFISLCTIASQPFIVRGPISETQHPWPSAPLIKKNYVCLTYIRFYFIHHIRWQAKTTQTKSKSSKSFMQSVRNWRLMKQYDRLWVRTSVTTYELLLSICTEFEVNRTNAKCFAAISIQKKQGHEQRSTPGLHKNAM